MKFWTFDDWLHRNPDLLEKLEQCECSYCDGQEICDCKTLVQLKKEYEQRKADQAMKAMELSHAVAKATNGEVRLK